MRYVPQLFLNLQVAPLELSRPMVPVYYKRTAPTEPTVGDEIEGGGNFIEDKATMVATVRVFS